MTSDKRMSEERLETIRGIAENWRDAYASPINSAVCGRISMEIVAEIDALRADLAAARRVEDGQVAFAITWLRERARKMDGDTIASCNMISAADLLTRLSAAKAEAERERDEARAALAQAREAAPKNAETSK